MHSFFGRVNPFEHNPSLGLSQHCACYNSLFSFITLMIHVSTNLPALSNAKSDFRTDRRPECRTRKFQIPSSTLLFEFSMKIRPQRIGRFSFRTTVFRLRYLMYVGTEYEEERRIQKTRKKEGSLCVAVATITRQISTLISGVRKNEISKSCLWTRCSTKEYVARNYTKTEV